MVANANVVTARNRPAQAQRRQADDEGHDGPGGAGHQEGEEQVEPPVAGGDGTDGGADPDEAHLAERHLTRPAGEQDDRDADDGEDEHAGGEQQPRRPHERERREAPGHVGDQRQAAPESPPTSWGWRAA